MTNGKLKLTATILATIGSIWVLANYFSEGEDLTERTIRENNAIYTECFTKHMEAGNRKKSNGQDTIGSGARMMDSGYVPMTDTERYRISTDCWKSKRKLTPDDLFLTVPKYLIDEKKCTISQTEDDHVKPERGGMYATDLACNFKEQGVYAPDYLDKMIEYKIDSVGYDNLLGNFVILSFQGDENEQTRWYFGHTVLDGKWKVGDIIQTGVRFARADLSGATTGWHTHIELRRMYDGVWQSVRYVTRAKERKLEEKRLGSMSGGSNNQGTLTGNLVYYFTHYDLGDVRQNDSSPCVSADGKDSCELHKGGRGTMALTVDIRKRLGINFGDKVALTGEVGCEGVYTVTDEMNCRFRGEYAWANGACTYSDGTPTPKVSHVIRPGTTYYIKGDLPGRPGGVCQIRKL